MTDLGIGVLSNGIARGLLPSVTWRPRNQPPQVRPSLAQVTKLSHLSKAQRCNSKTHISPRVANVEFATEIKIDGETEQLCTLEKRGNIFFLNLNGVAEHRLNPSLIESIRSALRLAQEQSTPGSALITTASGKFFSNGFDLAWAQSGGSLSVTIDRMHHLVELFKPLVADFTSLQMPTIAAVTGHAVAAGMLLAMSHDYVLMRSGRGVMFMSELDIGMSIPDYFMALIRSKVGLSVARRDVLLRTVKVKAAEAMSMGIVDSSHDSPEAVVEAAVRLGEVLVKRRWDGEIYAEIRKSLYPELCCVLGLEYNKILIKTPQP